MLQPLNKLPTQFDRSGFLVLTKDVSPERGNSIDGVVRPGGLKFSQQCLAGNYEHETVSGSGTIDIEGRVVDAPVGTPIVVPAGKRFTYTNTGSKDWQFKAKLPFWAPATFNYMVGSTHYNGDDVWFEIKRSSDSHAREPLYRLTAVAPGMNAAIVAVEPRAETIGLRAALHAHVITPIVGQGVLSVGSGQPGRIDLDRSIRVPAGEVHRIVNNTATTALYQLRPDPPRVWTPSTYEWEFLPGQFVGGSSVWFEFVFPN